MAKVLLKRSSETANDKVNPKLPNDGLAFADGNTGKDKLDFGELAINFNKGMETLSLRNSENEIYAFPRLMPISASDYEKLVEESKVQSNTFYCTFEDE